MDLFTLEHIYAAASDSITLINSTIDLYNLNALTIPMRIARANIDRNVRHLEIILAYENVAADSSVFKDSIIAAVAAGNAFLEPFE